MNKLIIITITIFSFVLIGCSKKGCVDSDSITYDSEAKKDDGTCQYQGNVSFWFNQNVSGFLVSYNVTMLTIYIDNASVGSISVNDWKSGPDCNGANFTVIESLGELKTKTFSYSARDQNGTQHFSGSFTITPNSCVNVQLAW